MISSANTLTFEFNEEIASTSVSVFDRKLLSTLSESRLSLGMILPNDLNTTDILTLSIKSMSLNKVIRIMVDDTVLPEWFVSQIKYSSDEITWDFKMPIITWILTKMSENQGKFTGVDLHGMTKHHVDYERQEKIKVLLAEFKEKINLIC